MGRAKPARHLALVQLDDAGEIVGRVDSDALKQLEAALAKAQGDVKALERDMRAKRRRITELERDMVRERLEHPDREFIKKVCVYWHRKCRPKDYNGRRRVNPMSPDRFDAVAALAEMQELKVVDGKRVRCWKYGAEHFKAAVDGGAFDPYTPTSKNGVKQPQNDLEQICRSVSKFEAFIRRAPYYEDRDDFELPLVPGFVRLDPLGVARAREARKDVRREFHNAALLSGGKGHPEAGYGCSVGSMARRGRGFLGASQTRWAAIQRGLVVGDEAFPPAWA